MSFTVPNVAGLTYPFQARVFETDWVILAAGAGGKNGRVSGCAVTQSGTPGMSVAVSAGEVVSSGVSVTVAGGSLSIATANATNPRFDLIVAENDGDIAVHAGTAAAAPIPPNPAGLASGTLVGLAMVYVPANDTAITDAQIVDKGVPVSSPLTGGPLWTTLSKSADQSRTSTNVLADDSVLKFTMAANTKYRIRGTIWAVAATTPDFQYGFAGPASPTIVVFRRKSGTDAAAYTMSAPDVAYPTAITISSVGAADGISVAFEAIVHNGANAGTFSFQWAQGTSNGSATTVRAGSYIEYAVS